MLADLTQAARDRPSGDAEKSCVDAVGCLGMKMSREILWNFGNYPLVMTNSLLLKMTLEIVDFPIENGDFPQLLLNYHRKYYEQVSVFIFPRIMGVACM